MSAARLELAWDTHNQLDSFPVRLSRSSGSDLVRHIGSARKQPAQCPECGSVIYSRRQKLCGVCCHALPEHLLFSDIEALRVERILKLERQRHRQWMAQRKTRD